MLGTAAAALAFPVLAPRLLAAPPSDQESWAVDDQQPFGGQTRRLKIRHGKQFIAALIFPTDYPTHFRLKPELYPLCTPSGVPVTGSHEYSFIHHQSVMCGHGGVIIEGEEEVIDFYRQLNFAQPNRSDPFRRGGPKNLFTEGPSGIQRVTAAQWTVAAGRLTIDLTLQWQTRRFNDERGETVVHERRRYAFLQQERATVVDLYTRLSPADRPIVLRADRHSLLGVRVHDLIDVEDGGTMIDSRGRTNPSGDYWDEVGERAAPRWIDCTGRIGPSTVGMCMLSHRANVRNQFYVREFGLMILSPTLGDDLRVTADQPLSFAGRFVAHDGPLDRDAADAWYRQFSEQKLL